MLRARMIEATSSCCAQMRARPRRRGIGANLRRAPLESARPIFELMRSRVGPPVSKSVLRVRPRSSAVNWWE
jgi:hypothetical protein